MAKDNHCVSRWTWHQYAESRSGRDIVVWSCYLPQSLRLSLAISYAVSVLSRSDPL